jgi:long-chain acyl-CoA synthetase
MPQFRNLVEIHQWQADRQGPRPAFRFKRLGTWHDVTWEQYRADALACAAALVEAGVRPGDRVALLAENCPEWLVGDMGILTAAAVNVPPHSPLSARQVHFELHDAGARWLFVSNREQLDKARQIRRELPDLQGIVVFDAECAGPDATAWCTFLQRGRQALPRLREELARRQAGLKSDDLATIMYTSGTTGNPKGVMLTHGNLVSNACACLEASPYEPGSILLSWLPYSHIYARLAEHYQSLVSGVLVCLAESAETVVQNLAEVVPTHLCAVPRFYEKVLAAVASPDPAVTAKKLKMLFGPRINWLSSGGAPLSKPVAEAFHAAGLLLLQGYGLTESSPVISFNRKTAHKLGTVGKAIPGVEVKIAPDGEVLTRGPHVMKGYWSNPRATAEAIRDGWLYTGDLGSLDDEGFLTITGRKKEMMVLSNGKKVVPPNLEGLLVANDCIDQALVCGEGKAYLTALIVPNWANVRKAMQAQGTDLNGLAPEQLAKDRAVGDFMRRQIDAALKDQSHWEQIRKFVVLPNPFTVAADELTVSLKLRRNVVLEKYAALVEDLYRDDSGNDEGRSPNDERSPNAESQSPKGRQRAASS